MGRLDDVRKEIEQIIEELIEDARSSRRLETVTDLLMNSAPELFLRTTVSDDKSFVRLEISVTPAINSRHR